MRKVTYLLIAALLVMTFAITGCGDDGSAAAGEAAGNFLTAMQDGDLDKLNGLADKEVLSSSSLGYDKFDTFEEELLSAAGAENVKLGKDAKAALDSFKKDFADRLVESYELGDVSINDDGTATANAHITLGLAVDKLADIDTSTIGDVDSIINDYMEKNQSELLAIYQKGGQDKLMEKMLNDLLPVLLEKASDAVFKAAEGTTEEDLVLSLAKNDDGEWIVTKVAEK